MYSNQGEGRKPINKIGFAVSGEGASKHLENLTIIFNPMKWHTEAEAKE